MTDPKEQTPARIRVWPKPSDDPDFKVLDEYSMQPIKGGDEVPYTRLTIRRINAGDLLTKDPEASTSDKRTKAETFGKADV
jgi:hypothetical protein